MTIQLRRFLMLQLLCAFLSKAFGKLVMLIFLYIMLIVNSNKRFCSLCANFLYFYNCVCLVPGTCRYTPPVSAVLKNAWIQYIAFFVVVAFLLFRLNSFVFRHKVRTTCWLTSWFVSMNGRFLNFFFFFFFL
jgi:hypothetical protein